MMPTGETGKEEELPVLTLDVLNTEMRLLTEKKIEVNGKQYRVVFRKLSYGQMVVLDGIPNNDTARYVKTVIHTASTVPRFETVDDLNNMPLGFVRAYSNLILNTSSKDPFLS